MSCLLALTLALAMFSEAFTQGLYEAQQFKGIRSYKPTKIHGLYIPDGQCSGVATRSDYGCSGGVIGVYASVSDTLQPDVSVGSDLQSVTVRRVSDARGRCAGQVALDLRVACWLDARQRPTHAPHAPHALLQPRPLPPAQATPPEL